MNKIRTKQYVTLAAATMALGLSHLTHAAAPAYGITDLGTPPGYPICTATGINNAGQVVGTCYTSDYSGNHAFLWSAGSITDLGTLPGQTASTATAINASGQVVGVAGSQPFLWNNGAMTALGVPPNYPSNCMPTDINSAGAAAGTCSTPDAVTAERSPF